MSNTMTGSEKAAAAGTAAEKRKVKLEIKDLGTDFNARWDSEIYYP